MSQNIIGCVVRSALAPMLKLIFPHFIERQRTTAKKVMSNGSAI
jgi:hypothetical protein